MTPFSVVLLAFAADALAAQQVLGPLDVFEVEYAQDPQISPDGSGHRPLTTGDFADTSPRWSPDASRVAFISDRDGAPQIWVRFMDSGEIARVTNLRHPPAGISWSPDGTPSSSRSTGDPSRTTATASTTRSR